MGKFEDSLIAGGFGLGQLLDQISLVYAQGNEGLTRSGELGFADSQQRYNNALQEAAIKEAQRKESKKKKKAIPQRILGTAVKVGGSFIPGAAPIANAAGNAIAGDFGTYGIGGGGLQKGLQAAPVGGGSAPFLEGALSGANPSNFTTDRANGGLNKALTSFAPVAPLGYDINSERPRRLY